MPIVSSSYSVGHAQHDGRHYVREVHLDGDGVSYVREYLADTGADYDALMTVHAQKISAALVDLEIEQVLNG